MTTRKKSTPQVMYSQTEVERIKGIRDALKVVRREYNHHGLYAPSEFICINISNAAHRGEITDQQEVDARLYIERAIAPYNTVSAWLLAASPVRVDPAHVCMDDLAFMTRCAMLDSYIATLTKTIKSNGRATKS